jgi:NAD(P)-dependent dehydrogenase (short-subunit alcohol dehydrogenase family)
MSEFSLEGKVAVITGASRGIGRAIAFRLARAGASVVVSSRKMANVHAVADEIAATGGRALAVQAHIGQMQDVQALVEQTLAAFGRLDIAVNNAATDPHFGPLLTADEGQWDKILDTNAKGAFRVCKAVVPTMQAQGGGKIINLASIAGLRPSPGMGIYGISKAAIIMLTKILALELGPANICCRLCHWRHFPRRWGPECLVADGLTDLCMETWFDRMRVLAYNWVRWFST